MAPTKGKQPTKGKKEILQGNKATLGFYTKIMIGSTALYIIMHIVLGYNSAGWFTFSVVFMCFRSNEISIYVSFMFTFWIINESTIALAALALGFSLSIFGGCFQAMTSMAKPTYSDDSTLIDGGIDLNMNSGMAEHLKDIILLTAIIQVLSIVSNYLWIFWLLAPSRAFYMLWTYILAPWIFAAAPEPEMDPKAQKKLERKMKRGGMM